MLQKLYWIDFLSRFYMLGRLNRIQELTNLKAKISKLLLWIEIDFSFCDRFSTTAYYIWFIRWRVRLRTLLIKLLAVLFQNIQSYQKAFCLFSSITYACKCPKVVCCNITKMINVYLIFTLDRNSRKIYFFLNVYTFILYHYLL